MEITNPCFGGYAEWNNYYRNEFSVPIVKYKKRYPLSYPHSYNVGTLPGGKTVTMDVLLLKDGISNNGYLQKEM